MKLTLNKLKKRVKERALAIFYHDLIQQIIASVMLALSDPKIRFVLIIVTPGGILVPTTRILRNPRKAYRQMSVFVGIVVRRARVIRARLKNFKRKKAAS